MRGLSPPIFQSGGARAPSAPPISPPMHANRFHWCMIISIVALACIFALGAIGIITEFVVQQNKIFNLEQQLIAHNDSLNNFSKMVDDLELQLSHCKQCNSTVHSNYSSYDYQQLNMKLDNIAAAQTEIQRQLNSTQFTLSDHGQQIFDLQQQAQLRERHTY